MVTKQMRLSCVYHSTCYKLAYAYEQQGASAAARIALDAVEETAQSAHRAYVTTKGRLAQRLAQAIPSFEQIYNNQRINEIAQNIARAFQQYSQTIQSYASAIGERLLQNPDIRSLYVQFKQLVDDLKREFDTLNAEKALKMSKEALKLAASPSTWTTPHSRVITWDPKNGEVALEIRSPIDVDAQQHRLRAIWQRHESKWDQLKDKTQQVADKYLSQYYKLLTGKSKSKSWFNY